MLKCCRRTAKLSHAPSIANLLAQYTSLKGRPVREDEVIRWAVLAISGMAPKSINRICFWVVVFLIKQLKKKKLHNVPQTFAHLTVKPSGAAGDQNVAPALSLHVREESLDGLDGAQEIDLHDSPHGVQGLHLQRPHQAHTGVAHCRS